MNIKLAEKVFHEAKHNYLFKCIDIKLSPEEEWETVEYEYCSAHKLKLIEFIAKQIVSNETAEYIPLSIRLNEAIATNNTEKLVEIAESMLDEGEDCE